MFEDPRQKKIIDEARAFAEVEIRPNAANFDKRGGLPKEFIGKLSEKKYLAASFPEQFNGLALNPVYYGLFTEEIGKACCATRSLITVHTSLVGETLLRWGTDKQKAVWLSKMASGEKIGAFALSEPEAGSDAAAVQTSYVKKGNRYILNGMKKWISFGEIADFFIVIASKNKEITAFIVERELGGVKSKPIKGMLAGRGSHIAEIYLDQVIVPEENVLGRVGCGFTHIVSTALDHGRYSVAWAGVAIAQEALEAMVVHARKRSQFGKRIYEFQLIRGILGDAVTKIHAARALCLRAGELRNNRDPDAILETSMAKYFSSQVAVEVTKNAIQVHGADGCTSSYPVERLFREAKILEIIEGTSQIQQEIISRYGLKKYSTKK